MSRLPKAGVYFAYGQNFSDRESGLRGLNNMAKLLKKLHQEYPTFAAYLGLSNVDGESAERINMRQGKVGRPQIGFQKKPGVKKSIWRKYHIHIVIVGDYAATVAKKFCEIMSKRYESEKDSKHLKGNAFIDEKAKWDGYYSMSYFTNQAQNCRFVGDKELLAKYDRSSVKKEQALNAELYFPKKRGIGVEPRDLCHKINGISTAPEGVNSVLYTRQGREVEPQSIQSIGGKYSKISAGTAKAGTALRDSDNKAPAPYTHFTSRIITSKKYSYKYTPNATFDINTPAKRGFEQSDFEMGYAEKSGGLVSSAITGTANYDKPLIKSTEDEFTVLSQSLVGTDGMLIDPRKLFDPLDFDDTTDWAELFRIYDESPSWKKKSSTPKQREF